MPLAAQVPASETLTSARQVRELTPAEVVKGRPIQLEAVVTYSDPQAGLIFVQDDTAGIFVAVAKDRDSVRFGQRVKVEGTVAPGSRLPFIGEAKVSELGPGTLPEPRRPAVAHVSDGAEDGQWIEVHGTIRSLNPALEIVADGQRLKLWVPGDFPPPSQSGLKPGAVVGVRGVGGLDVRGPDILSGAVFVPSASFVTLDSPAPSPFGLPLETVASLRAQRTNAGAMVRVRGTVSGTTGDGLLVIQDATGSLRVGTPQRSVVRAGELVDVAGFCNLSTAVTLLEDAILRVSAPGLAAVKTARADGYRPEDFLPLLTLASEVRELPPGKATNGYPIRLRGTVTYADPYWDALFIQDSSAGIFVYFQTNSPSLREGDLVEVEGFSSEGSFAPVVQSTRARVLGTGERPRPLTVGFEALLGGSYDSQWVEVSGVVSDIVPGDRHTTLEIRSGNGVLWGILREDQANPPLARFLDARVRLRGVCATHYSDSRQFLGINLMIPSQTDILAESVASGDPFTSSFQPIGQVFQFKVPAAGFIRTLVKGTVTHAASASEFVLQDETGGLRVRLRSPLALSAGDVVEVAGYPALEHQAHVLQNSVARKTGSGPLPAPGDLAACLAARREGGLVCQDQIITAEGVFNRRTRTEKQVILTLQSGQEIISVQVAKKAGQEEPPDYQPGTVLRVTGVCSVGFDDWGVSRGIALLTRSGKDIEVVSLPSWWTTRRLITTLGLVLAAGLAGLFWTLALRRRVAEQTAEIRARLEHGVALQARYQDLVENASDVIYTHDMKGRFTSFNHAAERLLGFTEAEAATMNLAQLVPPEFVEPVRYLLEGKLPVPGTFDLKVRAKDGRLLDLQVSLRLLLEKGQPAGVQNIARDVTEQRRAERATRLTEQLYRQAIAVADAVPYRLHYATNTFTFMGENIREIAGHTAAEMTPALWNSLVREVRMRGEAAGMSFEEAVHAARSGKLKRWVNDTRIVTRAGETRWVSDCAIQVLDEQGQPAGSIGILQDITERIRTEEERARNEARFRSVVESRLIGMAFSRADGTITLVNQRFADLLGYPVVELMDGKRAWRDLTSPEHTAADDRAAAEMQATGYCEAYEKELVKRDGTRVPVLIGATFLDNTRQEAVSFVLDLSERVNLETQLRQAQKMESIGRLAGGVAHDFNNILTVILGHCNLLLLGPSLAPEAVDSVQEIQASTTRAANLTKQLLTFSRKQVVQLQDLDLNEVIAQITRMLTRLLGEDVSLVCNYGSHLPAVHADRGMMEQILVNLAVNARDAMPDGGRLTVETSAVTLSGNHLSNAQAREGRFVLVTVTDTGQGMDEATLSHIFEPFFTTKEVGKGTGLGLASVYGIVEMHRGWIEVSSRPNAGAAFQIYLPAVERAVNGADREQPVKPAQTGRGETILVAEDEPALRHLIHLCLTAAGYQVILASTGPQAIEQWEGHKGKIDLLLTDMVMPDGMTGRQLVEKLRGTNPGLKVIFSSGYSVDLVGQGCELIEGFNFLAKPYGPSVLAKAVRSRLDA